VAEKIIMDVDTGHDDMVAIIMASALEEIDLLGIVAVCGNQVLEKTLVNTLNVCNLIGEKAPVFAGMDRPIIRERVVAGDVHGESGLDGPLFPPLSKQAEKTHGVNFIIETVMNNPHEVTLVPTGPLSNIAMAIRLEPRLPAMVKRIVLMGGSLGAGNRTAHAEFNIFADGEAAAIVLNCGAPIVMMGLDVTLQVLLKEERLARYRALNTATATMFNASMEHYIKACRRHGAEYPAMHDPCCIAYIVDPTIFETEEHTIEVVLADKERYGKTVSVPLDPARRILVGKRAATERFWPLLERSFANLP